MDKLVYAALNGMKVIENRQANTYNEMANVSTVGFKRSLNSAVIWRDLVAEDHLDSRAYPILVGENYVDLAPGPMMQTGVNLDAYINDKGLLAVQGKDGTEAYTRRGDLKVTENGILTTGAGDLVLGDAGPITIPPSSKIELSDDGVLSVTPMGQDATVLLPIARLKLVNGDKVGLKIRPDGLYETPDAQPLPVDASIRLSVGALEGSSVSPVESMVQMIKDAREYEMHVRVIRNAKELSTSSTSMVRLDS